MVVFLLPIGDRPDRELSLNGQSLAIYILEIMGLTTLFLTGPQTGL